MSKIKPKIIRIDSEKLQLDLINPRLPAHIQTNSLEEVWEYMKAKFELNELASSMVENGYFEAQPLVAIPEDEVANDDIQTFNEILDNASSYNFIVVEGNRRLSSIQGLLNNKFENYKINNELIEQFKSLPVLVYPNRDSVSSFIGVHHLAGVRKWNVFERASYIVKQVRENNQSIKKLQETIGDRRNSARKIFVCYRLIELAKEYNSELNISGAQHNFSYLQVATGQQMIREYIGLNSWNDIRDIETPIPREYLANLDILFNLLFGTVHLDKVLSDSRSIGEIAFVLQDEKATQFLLKNRELDRALKKVGGDIIAINKYTDGIDEDINLVRTMIEDLTYDEEINPKKLFAEHNLLIKYRKISDRISQILDNLK